jgi:nucleoid-associated protein YgaU
MALTKAVIVNTDARIPLPIPVMFNPPEYQLTRTSRFAEIEVPGLPSSVLQYVGSDAQTLTMELFFDTTYAGVDVRTRTEAIVNLTVLDPLTKAPPRLLLLWGSLIFPCVLISVKQHYEYFNSLGMPLRARLNVEFKGNDKLENLVAQLPLSQVDQAVRHIVKTGETLQAIAAEQLGDPGKWRQIAQANNIDDPRAVPAGAQLNIPRLF